MQEICKLVPLYFDSYLTVQMKVKVDNFKK